MDTFVVVVLCSLGTLLILLEFFLIPGVTFLAIVGLFSTIGGIRCAFTYLGFKFGIITLGLIIFTIITSITYIVKSNLLNKIALEANIESTVASENILNISEGDEGITISRLNPIGKVEVNNVIIEGKSLSNFIDEDTKIIVLKVNPTQLIVKIK